MPSSFVIVFLLLLVKLWIGTWLVHAPIHANAAVAVCAELAWRSMVFVVVCQMSRVLHMRTHNTKAHFASRCW